MKKQIELQDVKRMADDPVAIRVAFAVMTAMACESAIRAIVEPIQQEVIDAFRFINQETGEEINNSRQMYMASDEDFRLYMADTRRLYRDKGIQPENPDHCPLLVAEDLTRKAKQNMIDYCEQYTGIGHSDLFYDFPNDYNNYIDLTLRFFAPKVKALKEKEK